MTGQKPQLPSWLYQSVLAGVLWASLWALSMLMTAAPYESVWFPAAGITVVAMLLSGYRAIPGLSVAIVLTSLWGDFLFGVNTPLVLLLKGSVCSLVTHIGVYWLVATTFRFCMRRYAIFQDNGSPLVLVIGFIALTLIGAFINVWLVLEVLGRVDLVDIGQKQLLFWALGFGDAIGILVVAPICLTIASIAYPRVKIYLGSMSFQNHPADIGPVVTKASVALVTLIAVLTFSYFSNSAGIAALFFLMLIPLFWMVLTESPSVSAITLALLVFLASLFIDSFGLLMHELIYQSALIIMAVSTWLIIAVRATETEKAAQNSGL